MVFFDVSIDGTGQQQFQVSSRWWYSTAASVVLTVIVFAVWVIWQHLREREFAKANTLELMFSAPPSTSDSSTENVDIIQEPIDYFASMSGRETPRVRFASSRTG